jgi:3-oxoacyl-[acyl-carrier-protein] synthase-3
VLFGDGAGAALVGPVAAGHGALRTLLTSHGDEHRLIGVPAGGSRLPASAATLADGSHHFQMDGRGVRSFVHRELPLAIEQLLRRADVPGKMVKHFVPHQANAVMLAEVWPALGLENAALHLTVEAYGNTGAASVAITLDALQRSGALLPGDLVLLAAFGGGMSVGASLHRWAVPGQDVDVRAVGRSREAIASR